MLKVFIEYDPNEIIAYHTLCQSIFETCKEPVAITPLKLSTLPMFNRERNPLQSTEFSFSRFLVPYLSNYDGYSVFIDCDMMVTHDIGELVRLAHPERAVSVIKHIYEPATDTKFLGATQTKYEKKNWSSVMVFNNKMCRRLTPEYVNTASGLDLHQFKWTDELGSLPLEWGYLVGEHEKFVAEPKLIHWTLGGPYFKEYEDCEYAGEWGEMMNKVVSATDPSSIVS